MSVAGFVTHACPAVLSEACLRPVPSGGVCSADPAAGRLRSEAAGVVLRRSGGGVCPAVRSSLVTRPARLHTGVARQLLSSRNLLDL